MTLGQQLDALGLELDDAEPGELTEAAIVACKVVTADGRVGLRVGTSPGLSWLEAIGIVHAAAQLLDTDQEDDL